MPIARYAVAALLGFVLLVGAMLLVRPLIFSLAPPRDDSSYAVAPQSELANGPIVRELPLNSSHGIPGERLEGRVTVVRIVVSSQPGQLISAVNGWSAVHDCAVEPAGDRLRDCDGATWTFDGVPIDASQPLVRFPARAESGAIMVDFTRPLARGVR
ncbi:MAG TPA: hypothetical protein VFM74_04745 [Candidatus Limnocylindria bacterium]|nr:hypothetical protein [Candidatus Limnocylindria bacterium]